MRLLVLGGSRFLGRAVVDDALEHGWDVTTFNRRGTSVPGVESLTGDRLDAPSLDRIATREWGIVVDTWAGAPRAVRDSARVLAGRAERYVYVSSGSVYKSARSGGPGQSTSPPRSMRNSHHGRRPTSSCGPRIRPARAISARSPNAASTASDARDLARWMLDGATGTFNAVAPPGHATMGTLLEACRAVTGAHAELVWADPVFVQEQGVEPWQDLPIWIPDGHEYRGMHAANVDKALAAGLTARPVEETVSDTWEWLLAVHKKPRLREDLPAVGLDPDRERAILEAWRA